MLFDWFNTVNSILLLPSISCLEQLYPPLLSEYNKIERDFSVETLAQLFFQVEVINLVCDLNFLPYYAQGLASQMKEKNLKNGVHIPFIVVRMKNFFISSHKEETGFQECWSFIMMADFFFWFLKQLSCCLIFTVTKDVNLFLKYSAKNLCHLVFSIFNFYLYFVLYNVLFVGSYDAFINNLFYE